MDIFVFFVLFGFFFLNLFFTCLGFFIKTSYALVLSLTSSLSCFGSIPPISDPSLSSLFFSVSEFSLGDLGIAYFPFPVSGLSVYSFYLLSYSDAFSSSSSSSSSSLSPLGSSYSPFPVNWRSSTFYLLYLLILSSSSESFYGMSYLPLPVKGRSSTLFAFF